MAKFKHISQSSSEVAKRKMILNRITCCGMYVGQFEIRQRELQKSASFGLQSKSRHQYEFIRHRSASNLKILYRCISDWVRQSSL